MDTPNTKICCTCQKAKDLSCFSKYKKSHDGLQGNCKECCSELNSLWYKANYAKNKEKYKNKSKEYARRRYREDPEFRKLRLERQKQYVKEHPEYLKGQKVKQYFPELTGKEAYAEYQRLFQEQSGKCKICEREQSELKDDLSVDHNHATGEVRGLLCATCNWRLLPVVEHMEHLIKQALIYLKKT